MDLVRIYSCLCDVTRLRILHLLSGGPLCVCHFQEVLEESQVKISKHLNYLKVRGLVVCRRDSNWMIYSLPEKQTSELRTNLACLQECVSDNPVFRRDAQRMVRLRGKFESNSPLCCAPSKVGRKAVAAL